MSVPRARGLRPLLFSGAAVFVALVAGATPTFATELSHTGKIGHHQLNDGAGNPGAVCNYQSGSEFLDGFSDVLPPTIWSRDTTAGRDKQKVGWRYLIKRRADGQSNWKTVYKSSIVKADAWNDQPAQFMSRTAPGLMLPTTNASFYIVIKQFWYAANGSTVVGTATSEVDVYLEKLGAEQNELNSCANCFLH